MTKAEAGALGGRRTVELHGREHMRELAKRGAAAYHRKYKIVATGTSDFAIVLRENNQPTGKTINGKHLPWAIQEVLLGRKPDPVKGILNVEVLPF